VRHCTANGRVALIRKALVLMVSRYVAYAISFVRGIWVAAVLGPGGYGVWGFLVLIQAYLKFLGLGVPTAISRELALEKRPEHRDREIRGFLTVIALVTSVLAVSGFVVADLFPDLFLRYRFHLYSPLVAMAAVVVILREFFFSLLRVYGALHRISAMELLTAVALMITVPLSASGDLIRWLLLVTIGMGALTVFVSTVRVPFRLGVTTSGPAVARAATLGLPFLIANFSVHLIAMSGRTVVSVFYTVEEMGYYSLATSISNAVFLGLAAVAWALYPKLVEEVGAGSGHGQVLERVDAIIVPMVMMTTLTSVALLPVLLLVLSDFEPARNATMILLMSQGVFLASFSHRTLAHAQRHEGYIARLAFASFLVNATAGLLLAFLDAHFTWIAVATAVSLLGLSVAVTSYGGRLMGEPDRSDRFFRIMGLEAFLSMGVAVGLSVLGYSQSAGVVALGLYVLLARRRLSATVTVVSDLLRRARRPASAGGA